MRKLTARQQKFVEEYLIDLNATQAAIRAGYSVRNAGCIGSELLEKTRIQDAISEQVAKRSRRTGITQDRVLRELARIAFVKITDVIDDYGNIKRDADPDDLACIEGCKVKETETKEGGSSEREVKLVSKLKALELLGKHLGMWNDKINVNMTLPVMYEGETDLED